MKKLQVYHIHNGQEGGVYTVIRTLLAYNKDPLIENHIIYTINQDQDKGFQLQPIKGAATQQVFYYSPRWNFYYTSKKLARFLSSKEALVVAHDWLELGMAEHTALANPVVFVVHGNYEYYYNLAILHAGVIDKWVAINPVIYKKLQQLLPGRSQDIVQCYFPVPRLAAGNVGASEQLRIIFIAGNVNDKNKNFPLVEQVIQSLPASDFVFTIVGEVGKLAFTPSNEKVNFTGFLPPESIYTLLDKQDCCILPSFLEGLPVSLVECMKKGIVPLVSHWEGGADELVVHGETGFQLDPGTASAYIDQLQTLQDNRQMLQQLSVKAMSRANKLFNPVTNVDRFHQVWMGCKKEHLTISRKLYGSRLDKPWLPNFIVTGIRTCKRLLNKS